MKNILITGGAGFIGSNLARLQLSLGNYVTVYDNFQTGHEDNIRGLSVNVIKDAISNIDKYDLSKYDSIIHLGMPSTMMLYRNDSVESVKECIVGSHKILEACRINNTKLIFASSSSLYNGLIPPLTEDREIFVKDFYTEGRLFVERLAKLYGDLYGVNSIGFRFFAVYGPREEHKLGYANMVSQFLWSIWHDESPLIFGDGSQTRDFTYVDDVTRILSSAADKDFDKPEIFNIGTSHNFTFNDIVSAINKKLGKNIQPTYKPNPIKNYIPKLLADITKLSEHFEPPKIQLDEGLDILINYYKTSSAPPKLGSTEDYWISKVKTK
ncbi:MAG: NAD-dependent epimerase/dehydratase [uncultured bacterium]|nr:MAG: NAD-dependent epimerase/dehydratase [uncultured bacterium]